MATEPRIGTRIRRARERMRPKMTQGDLARRLGVSRSSVNAWENDRMYPRGDIGALEEILGVSLTDDEPSARRPSSGAAEALDRAQRELDELRRILRSPGKGESDHEARRAV